MYATSFAHSRPKSGCQRLGNKVKTSQVTCVTMVCFLGYVWLQKSGVSARWQRESMGFHALNQGQCSFGEMRHGRDCRSFQKCGWPSVMDAVVEIPALKGDWPG